MNDSDEDESIGVGTQSTLGGTTFLSEKIRMKN